MRGKEPSGAFIEAWGAFLLGLSQQLDTIADDRRALLNLAAQPNRRVRLDELSPRPWGWLYEIPTQLQLFVCMTVATPLAAAEVLSSKSKLLDDFLHARDHATFGSIRRRVLGAFAVPALHVLQSNIESFLIYRCSLSEHVSRVREGNPDALKTLIGHDPAAIFAPTVARRLSRAAFLRDSELLADVGQVLKEPPKREGIRDKARLNAALLLMKHARQLDKLTKTSAYEILAVRARLYEAEDKNPGAREALWQLIYRFKRRHSTVFRE